MYSLEGFKRSKMFKENGFFNVEFEVENAVAKVWQLTSLALHSNLSHFRPWFHGFDPLVDLSSSFVLKEK